ncbi:hypothetical protein DW66_2358 [Pseudomonas putida]|nr:hypothetical protein DW66_2358 [Pseudomonas putida]AJG14256.1 hypothetical protein RK21_02748 [Pseudomonas plecoglossicida]
MLLEDQGQGRTWKISATVPGTIDYSQVKSSLQSLCTEWLVLRSIIEQNRF